MKATNLEACKVFLRLLHITFGRVCAESAPMRHIATFVDGRPLGSVRVKKSAETLFLVACRLSAATRDGRRIALVHAEPLHSARTNDHAVVSLEPDAESDAESNDECVHTINGCIHSIQGCEDGRANHGISNQGEANQGEANDGISNQGDENSTTCAVVGDCVADKGNEYVAGTREDEDDDDFDDDDDDDDGMSVEDGDDDGMSVKDGDDDGMSVKDGDDEDGDDDGMSVEDEQYACGAEAFICDRAVDPAMAMDLVCDPGVSPASSPALSPAQWNAQVNAQFNAQFNGNASLVNTTSTAGGESNRLAGRKTQIDQLQIGKQIGKHMGPGYFVRAPMRLLAVDVTETTLTECARGNLVLLAEWLVKFGTELCATKMLGLVHEAAACGHVGFLEWLRRQPAFHSQLAQATDWHNRALRKAAGGGHVNAGKWVLSNVPDLKAWRAPRESAFGCIGRIPPNPVGLWWGVLNCAARRGRVEFALWVLDYRRNEPFLGFNLLDVAAGAGQLMFAKKINAHPSFRFGLSPATGNKLEHARLIRRAIGAGHLCFAQWAKAAGASWGRGVVMAAAERGDLGSAKWALEQGYVVYDGHRDKVLYKACWGGSIEFAQWALSVLGSKWTDSCAVIAMRYGHVAFCRWALGAGCPVGNLCVSDIMLESHAMLTKAVTSADVVSTAKWLRSLGCDWYEHDLRDRRWPPQGLLYDSAAKRGDIAFMQWALAENCRLTGAESMYEFAAAGGHLQFAQWLRATMPHIPLVSRVLSWAASKGRLKFAKWARQEGAAWHSSYVAKEVPAVCLAAQNGYYKFAQWAADDGCPYVIDSCIEAAQRASGPGAGSISGSSSRCSSSSSSSSSASGLGPLPAFVRRTGHIIVGSF